MMKLSNKNTRVILLVIAVVGIYFLMKNKELYIPRESAYKYGTVDTNPARRTSQFFDNCSPENMADCKRNNPYEGLPLP
jgi:hypothetical protein|tara:strand:- start:578 stop:814 length:237 start_codon:yes stop_codon:yes gene_type:complete